MNLLATLFSKSGIASLPFVKQNQPGGDGLACINSILMHRRLSISLSDIESRYPDFKQCINLRQVMDIFSDYKIQTRALQCPINELVNLKLPCILHWDMKQFVILAKTEDKKYEILNPADKKRFFTEDELERHYNEIALEILSEKNT